jgi:hypothetical protein
MTILRGLAVLMVLILSAPHSAWAQAGGPLIETGDVLYGGRCPRLCVEWFDGCNNCTCGKGRIDVCSRHICRWRRRARCLRWGF